MVALAQLDPVSGSVFLDTIISAMRPAQRALLEADVSTLEQRYQRALDNWFIKRFRDDGIAEGEARGEARAVLAVLAARGIAVSDEQRGRILACTDIAQLDRWVRAAAVVAEAAALF